MTTSERCCGRIKPRVNALIHPVSDFKKNHKKRLKMLQSLWPPSCTETNTGTQNDIESSQPEWCISSMIYSRDTPFWPGTLDRDRLVGLVVKASASRAEGPGFESRLRRDFFGVESYQSLKNGHSSGYPARRLAL